MEIPRATMDFEFGFLEIETPDGPMRQSMPEPLRRIRREIRRVVSEIENDKLVLTLAGGVEATVELGVKTRDTADALTGRRVVYLDQNRWSAMAAWRHGHKPVDKSEAAAAERLAALVTDQEIVLPMSAGHVIETGPLYGERRAAHASTVLQYSRGWQMRNPVEVRKEELSAALDGRPPVADSLVSLGADVLFTRSLRPVNGSDLPESMALALPRLVHVLSVCGVLVNEDRVADEGGRAAVEKWAKNFEDLGADLSSRAASQEEVRLAAHKAVLRDFYDELVDLASMPAIAAWLESSENDLSATRYLSRYRWVIFSRLRNVGAKWRGSDFTDLNYLCCAAGYADLVVGERRTISDLRAVPSGPCGAMLATSLAEAVACLESMG
jgi:hypothetical protein